MLKDYHMWVYQVQVTVHCNWFLQFLQLWPT